MLRLGDPNVHPAILGVQQSVAGNRLPALPHAGSADRAVMVGPCVYPWRRARTDVSLGGCAWDHASVTDRLRAPSLRGHRKNRLWVAVWLLLDGLGPSGRQRIPLGRNGWGRNSQPLVPVVARWLAPKFKVRH